MFTEILPLQENKVSEKQSQFTTSNNEHNNGYGNIGTVLVKLRKQAATVYRAGILFLIRSVSDM